MPKKKAKVGTHTEYVVVLGNPRRGDAITGIVKDAEFAKQRFEAHKNLGTEPTLMAREVTTIKVYGPWEDMQA